MIIQDLLATGSGALVGFTLGLIGGGGSILAVPLLVYVVGVSSTHIAIGTSAIAVAASAIPNLIGHARAGHVKWRCAVVFACAGVTGAVLGSSLGKTFDGQKLLALFGLLMIVIALKIALQKETAGDPNVRLSSSSAATLLPPLGTFGVGAGALAGFFGIGGGFLVVPGIIAATNMPMIYAIGSSLVSVAAFGLTTAVNYAISGLIEWKLVAFFIFGGAIGGVAGRRIAETLSKDTQRLSKVFATIVAVVGAYIVYKTSGTWISVFA